MSDTKKPGNLGDSRNGATAEISQQFNMFMLLVNYLHFSTATVKEQHNNNN